MDNTAKKQTLGELVEVIIEKRTISSQQQRSLNSIALNYTPQLEEIEKLGEITSMIRTGAIKVEN